MPRTRHIAGAITAALLFSSAASAANTDFSKVVIFGDSLSDAGNIATAGGSPIPLRFTTNPGLTTAEIVANALGKPVTASLLGGTDYAFGGAGVVNNSAAGPIPTLPQQMGMYLAANGGKADSKALYQVWGGANDIFYLSATNPTNPNAVAAGAQVAAQTELGMLGQLQAAGAKYVIVYNLPDLGKTPASLSGGAAAASGATQVSILYNSVLNVGLNQLSNNGLNIIPINTYALLNEAIANPAAYGFTNVTTPACTVASSINCTPNTLVDSNAAKTYLFADGVHPTTAAHAMLGQYVVSVLRAPSQISLLGEAPLASISAQNRAIRNEMLADGIGSDTRAFASVDYGQQQFKSQGLSPKTDSDNVNLTIGADVKASDHWSVGVAMGIGSHSADFQGGGGYKLQDISGLGYVTWHQGGGYVGGYASFGQANYSDIERRVTLGAMQRTESGKADGSHLGGGLTGGYWFDFSGLRTGPFANVEWQTVKVNGYAEGGNSSSSMWFNRQQRDALISTIGWRLQGHWQTSSMLLQPYAEIAWNHDSKADPRFITAGLNTMSGYFALPGFSPDKTWATADLGLSAQFTQSITGWLGYSGRFSDNSQKYNSVNMGVKFGF